jgi:hypothetical protein
MLPGTVTKQPEGILDATKRMADLLGERNNSLIVIAAHLDIDTVVSLERELTTPRWELADVLKTNRILGKYEDHPVLHLNDLDSNSLYVTDVPRFASLIQYDPQVDLLVSAMDEESAIRMLENNPDPKLDMGTLLSMVHLVLYQSYEIKVHDQHAIWSAKLLA